MKKIILAVLFAIYHQYGFSNCRVLNSDQSPVVAQGDPLFLLLNSLLQCPKNVLELKSAMENLGLNSKPTLVSNRGFHNSRSGSFSIFETAQGSLFGEGVRPEDFYFGHFTGKNASGDLFLQQAPSGLMVELIAWDKAKGAYNFYELIGDGVSSHWIYRGDSFDIFDDVKNLHLQEDPSRPKFGQKLRCSGCHTSGGPIMKELSIPNNDWWTGTRPFSLAGLQPTEEVQEILDQLEDARSLKASVEAGIEKLELSPTIRKIKSGSDVLSLPEILRPLFATVEINLESDLEPLDSNSDTIKIPSAYWVDPRLSSINIEISKSRYLQVLDKLQMSFPESGRQDSDHAWLTPVKSLSDRVQIDKLRQSSENSGLIQLSDHFIVSVLAVDPLQPVFSEKRRVLLRHLPTNYSPTWESQFVQALQSLAESGSETLEVKAATEFLSNYNLTEVEIRQKVQEKLDRRVSKLLGEKGIEKEVLRLSHRRQQISDSEISKNPRGQILEPGFRVVFPEHPPVNCRDIF